MYAGGRLGSEMTHTRVLKPHCNFLSFYFLFLTLLRLAGRASSIFSKSPSYSFQNSVVIM